MTEKEFREKMFKTKNNIWRYSSYSCNQLLICFYLFPLVKESFEKIISGNDAIKMNVGWYGNPCIIENQLMRIDALSLFEEYCISEGIYKEF